MKSNDEITCGRDHCTPEERAVIEAAVRDRQSETKSETEAYGASFDRVLQSRREFRLAVTQLLAARGETAKDPLLKPSEKKK